MAKEEKRNPESTEIESSILFQKIEDKLIEKINVFKLDTSKDLMKIVEYAMELVELSPLKGTKQKDFVIDLVKDVIYKTNMNEDEKQMVDIIFNSGAISQTIDLIVQATKGELNINTIVETTTQAATGCCLPLLQRIFKR